VKALLDLPDEVTVTTLDTAGTVTYEVTVAPSDMGKIIGRNGRVIQSVRTFVKAAALKTGERAYVEVVN